MSNSPEALLERAKTIMISSHNALKGDDVIPDLKEFEGLIKSLCEQVTAMPKGEAEPYRKAMEELSKTLEELAKNMENKKDQIQSQIENLDYNKKAQVAYRVAGSLKPKDKGE